MAAPTDTESCVSVAGDEEEKDKIAPKAIKAAVMSSKEFEENSKRATERVETVVRRYLVPRGQEDDEVSEGGEA
ncbi:hypothetical protein V493_00542 [Pseudogymnoascus sp. VKM F-4281 (FW-2241)]|nr:hypothetical protein V493_00542 [Pseudogymnoascus sp. VKM F-4281 (FW-2241)]